MSRSIRCTRFSVAWRQMEGFTCLHAFRVWTPRRFPQCAVFGVCPHRSLGSVPTAVSFKRKMFSFYSEVGAKRMRELGPGSRTEFAEAMAAKVFGHLPPASPDGGEKAA